MSSHPPEVRQIVDAIHAHQRFVLSSHARPDGDAIGSEMAMAYALRALGKEVRVVNKDAAAPPILEFPGVAGIDVSPAVTGDYDVAIIMECGDLARTGVDGLDRGLLINIDHHPGNTAYGAINWFDAGASACAELVFTIVEALGVPITHDIATHIYLAILTDTGSFHFSNMTPRTFRICASLLEAGVDPIWVARTVYDSNSLGRLRIFGSVLNGMQVSPSGRVAVIYIDHALAREAGGTYDDTEGLINLPLTVKAIQASIFFKQTEGDDYRISLRSKGAVDVCAIAREHGGGGHRNAAGCGAVGAVDDLQRLFVDKVERAIDQAQS